MTRKQKADELRRLLTTGPVLSDIGMRPGDFTPNEARRRTVAWLEAWVTPLCNDLIKELRDDA